MDLPSILHATTLPTDTLLFKTHKLNKDQLLEVDILDMPRRFLQSAGDITTSRITAFLEMIFKPISTNYCQFQLNEYCRDSKHYLMELENWKSTLPTNPTSTLFSNTADVKSLYPSVNRNLIPIALKQWSATFFYDGPNSIYKNY